ncbi:MAG: hypothetical protein QXP42_02680 [Candidatus Micrarchaeia archaeon]
MLSELEKEFKKVLARILKYKKREDRRDALIELSAALQKYVRHTEEEILKCERKKSDVDYVEISDERSASLAVRIDGLPIKKLPLMRKKFKAFAKSLQNSKHQEERE